MTEKRFNLWDIEGTAFIEDHKEGSYHIGKTKDVDINSLRDITKRLNIYADKNKQLKADNNRLINETARIVAEHQRKVLELIDKRIDKCEPIDYARNIEGDVPVFDCETATEIRVLNELKMELQE